MPDEGILSGAGTKRILVAGVTIALGTLVVDVCANRIGSSVDEARTIAVMTVIFFQLFQAINFRSLSLSVFKTMLSRNPLLILPVSVAFVAHMAAVYVPRLEWLVRTSPLFGSTLVGIFLLGFSVILTVELDKDLLRRERVRIRECGFLFVPLLQYFKWVGPKQTHTKKHFSVSMSFRLYPTARIPHPLRAGKVCPVPSHMA